MKRIHFTILLVNFLAVSVAAISARAADEKKTDMDFSALIEPGINYASVKGNAAKFCEDTWMKDKFTGGIEEFKLKSKVGKDLNLSVEGRGVFDAHDYRLQLELLKTESWFLRAGYNEFRKYFNGAGGYFATNNLGPVYALQNQDLHLDMRNIFVEIGLIRPNLPKITIGYERQEKVGMKSMLEWSTLNYTNTATHTSTNKKIYPGFKAIDEHTDIVKLELEHDIKNIHIGDEFRYEHYQAADARFDYGNYYAPPYSPTGSGALKKSNQSVTIAENFKNDLFWNTFHVESHLNEKVYWSFGYLYSRFDGDDGMGLNTVPFSGARAKDYYTTKVGLDSDSHVVNANLLYDPFKTLSLNIGIQAEKTDATSFQTGFLTETAGAAPYVTNNPSSLFLTQTDKRSLEENAGLRWTGIPFTTVYAEGKWIQEQTYFNWNLNEDGDVTLRDTQLNTQRQDYKIGFNSSPLPRLTLSSQYRHSIRNDDYDGDQELFVCQHTVSDEFMAKLTLHPCSRVNVSFKYQYVITDIQTLAVDTMTAATSGRFNSSIYTLSATVTPINRLYLTGLVSYQDTYTSSEYNGATYIAPYRGNVYTALASAGYALDNKTDLTAEYSFSYSDNFNANVLNGGGYSWGLDSRRNAIQVGVRRQLSKNVTGHLRYGYIEYVEPSTGGINNYRANMVMASCGIRF